MNKNFVCICIHCMDRRINADQAQGVQVFKMSNAGAAFPTPQESQSNTQEDSLHILLERAKAGHQTVLSAFAGHEDCVAVRSIWDVGKKPESERSARDAARLAPYAAVVEHVDKQHGIDDAEKLRLLTQAKTLQDINHAFAYDDIQAVVKDNELSILAYYEDVTRDPHALYLYDPVRQVFLPSSLRLKEFSEQPELLEYYALTAPVDIVGFVESKANYIRNRRYEQAMQAMMADSYSVEAVPPIVKAG